MTISLFFVFQSVINTDAPNSFFLAITLNTKFIFDIFIKTKREKENHLPEKNLVA
jgi:hypothetical protein